MSRSGEGLCPSVPSKAVAIRRALDPMEKEAGRERMDRSGIKDNQGHFTASAESAWADPTPRHGGEARYRVAALLTLHRYINLQPKSVPIDNMVDARILIWSSRVRPPKSRPTWLFRDLLALWGHPGVHQE